MVLARVTHQDPTLAHQIRLDFANSQHGSIWVKCACRRAPLGKIPVDGDPWAIYNNPLKHNRAAGPFVPGKKTWKVYDVVD